ncbi:MAG TPA: prepilin-type N-terminal cleavage/methylation domain-containing protein [Acidobacteriota bacterium]|nr:prepilin-type N-terminal cleavage/methylation domain-containing protein [Acidobacteriota bacterium]
MNHRTNQGFTLLELLIVILVMALVLTVSYPSLSKGSASMHLRTTGRDVLNIFRYAREKAVTEQVGMRVTADRESQRLVVADDLGDGGRFYLMPKDVKIERLALGGKEVNEASMVVRFLPNGGSDSAVIILRSATGSFLRIISDPLAGGARIDSGEKENLP